MRLLISLTSPFARKARMCVIEKGLSDKVATEVVNPWQDPPHLAAANPLCQVPTLLLDDGTAFFDSRVVCACLDTLGTAPRLLPEAAAERLRVLRLEALADGMTDAAVKVRLARVAEPGQSDSVQSVRQLAKIDAALKVMQQDAGAFGSELHLGQIAFGAALGYLDFRFPDLDWRARVPQLAVWYAAFSQRPSMSATTPKE